MKLRFKYSFNFMEFMKYSEKILLILLILASISYIGADITFLILDIIPSFFILIENITYSIVYILSSLLILKGKKVGILLTIITASFNAGRVSRSIIGTLGEIQPLALMHIPLLVGLIILTYTALINITE